MAKNKFTPTQDLILDVLLARHRLGEGFWTFDSRLKPSLVALSDAGYVFVMDGNVQNTIRAGLTPEGRMEFVGTYLSPLERSIVVLEDSVRSLTEQKRNLQEHLAASLFGEDQPQR